MAKAGMQGYGSMAVQNRLVRGVIRDCMVPGEANPRQKSTRYGTGKCVVVSQVMPQVRKNRWEPR